VWHTSCGTSCSTHQSIYPCVCALLEAVVHSPAGSLQVTHGVVSPLYRHLQMEEPNRVAEISVALLTPRQYNGNTKSSNKHRNTPFNKWCSNVIPISTNSAYGLCQTSLTWITWWSGASVHMWLSSLEQSEQPHPSGSIKHISLKYSKMKKQTEEFIQTGWFKPEI